MSLPITILKKLVFLWEFISIIDQRYLFTELYNKVDIALYNAKHNGRDRYVYYHEGMTYPK